MFYNLVAAVACLAMAGCLSWQEERGMGTGSDISSEMQAGFYTPGRAGGLWYTWAEGSCLAWTGATTAPSTEPSTKATYRDARERPMSLQADGVFNSEKDVIDLDRKAKPDAPTGDERHG